MLQQKVIKSIKGNDTDDQVLTANMKSFVMQYKLKLASKSKVKFEQKKLLIRLKNACLKRKYSKNNSNLLALIAKISNDSCFFIYYAQTHTH